MQDGKDDQGVPGRGSSSSSRKRANSFMHTSEEEMMVGSPNAFAFDSPVAAAARPVRASEVQGMREVLSAVKDYDSLADVERQVEEREQ